MSYIVYVDEAGDPCLKSVQREYPLLVLAFCIFSMEEYASSLAPNLLRFKFKHWGHAQTVLHERDIRKRCGDFRFLQEDAKREAFMEDLAQVIANTSFSVIASVVDKARHVAKYKYPRNAYDLALKFGCERTYAYLNERGHGGEPIHFIFESRGQGNDKSLSSEFARVCTKENAWGARTSFACKFSKKWQNDLGLQLADLIAHPIGRHVLAPNQANRAYDVIEAKLRRGPGSGSYYGYGLKVFPDVDLVPERWLGR